LTEEIHKVSTTHSLKTYRVYGLGKAQMTVTSVRTKTSVIGYFPRRVVLRSRHIMTLYLHSTAPKIP
jgi:hypothetical protein